MVQFRFKPRVKKVPSRPRESNKMIRYTRTALWGFLILQTVIWNLAHPDFLGIKPISVILRFFNDVIRFLFWPSGSEDVGTYKWVIYETFTFIGALPFYPFLAALMKLVFPLGYGATWLPALRRKLKALQAQGNNPLKYWTRFRSGMSLTDSVLANDYHDAIKEKCTVAFDQEPGVWVQILSGSSARSEVCNWDENGEIAITGVVRGVICLKLHEGKVYRACGSDPGKICWAELPRNTPLVLGRKNPGGELVPQCTLVVL